MQYVGTLELCNCWFNVRSRNKFKINDTYHLLNCPVKKEIDQNGTSMVVPCNDTGNALQYHWKFSAIRLKYSAITLEILCNNTGNGLQ